MKYNKNEILKLNSFKDLQFYEQDIMEDLRNEYYNTILKDKDIKKHIEDLTGSSGLELESKLMINGRIEYLPDIDIKGAK